VLHYGSTLLGAAVVVQAAWWIGRTRWLLADGLPAPLPATRPAVFWGVAVSVWLLGLAVQPFLSGSTEPQIIIVRLLELAATGGLLAVAAARTLFRDEVRR
jgi:hypothetical protein